VSFSARVVLVRERRRLGVSSGDILPAESGQATIIELQPVHSIDSSQIPASTASEPCVSLDPVGVVQPSGRAACDQWRDEIAIVNVTIDPQCLPMKS